MPRQRKRTKRPRPPVDFYQLRRDPRCFRRGPGRIEVQGYGLDPAGGLLCAGVHYVSQVDVKTAWRLAVHWQRWRRWYDTLPWNRAEEYPAKHAGPLSQYGIRPMEARTVSTWARVVG